MVFGSFFIILKAYAAYVLVNHTAQRLRVRWVLPFEEAHNSNHVPILFDINESIFSADLYGILPKNKGAFVSKQILLRTK
jgi:hypothetical protein